MNPRQRKFFDERAEMWDEMVTHDEKKLEKIAELLCLRHGDTVLDVGSGTGVMIPYLSKYIRKKGAIVAVDYSEKMIEVARKKFPNSENPHLKFFAEDIHDLPMRFQYDAILCYSCFPHFIDQRGSIQHMSNGLAANGKLMIAHSQSRDAINSLHKRAGAEVCQDVLPTSQEIEKMMLLAGLQIAEKIDNDELFIVMGERN